VRHQVDLQPAGIAVVVPALERANRHPPPHGAVGPARGGRRQPLPPLCLRIGDSNRSIVALLIASTDSRTAGSRLRCPWLSSDSTSSRSNACSRSPQSRSLASHSVTSVSTNSGP
jgi:hypothetical protein